MTDLAENLPELIPADQIKQEPQVGSQIVAIIVYGTIKSQY